MLAITKFNIRSYGLPSLLPSSNKAPKIKNLKKIHFTTNSSTPTTTKTFDWDSKTTIADFLKKRFKDEPKLIQDTIKKFYISGCFRMKSVENWEDIHFRPLHISRKVRRAMLEECGSSTEDLDSWEDKLMEKHQKKVKKGKLKRSKAVSTETPV